MNKLEEVSGPILIVALRSRFFRPGRPMSEPVKTKIWRLSAIEFSIHLSVNFCEYERVAE